MRIWRLCITFTVLSGVVAGWQQRGIEELQEVERLDLHAITRAHAKGSYYFGFSQDGSKIAAKVPLASSNYTNPAHHRSGQYVVLIDRAKRQVIATSKELATDRWFWQVLVGRADAPEIFLNDASDLLGLDSETLRELHRTPPEDFGSPFGYSLRTLGLSSSGQYLAAIYSEHERIPEEIRLTRRTRPFETRLYLFDLRKRDLVRQCKLESQRDDWFRIAVSSVGSQVVLAVTDGSRTKTSLVVFDTTACQTLQSWQIPLGVSEMALLPDDSAVALAFSKVAPTARVIRLEDGKSLLEMTGNPKGSFNRRLAVSPDGRWLAVDTSTEHLRWRWLEQESELRNLGASVWDLHTGRLEGYARLRKMKTSSWSPPPMAFTSDSRQLVLSAPDGTLRLFALPKK